MLNIEDISKMSEQDLNGCAVDRLNAVYVILSGGKK